MNTHKIVSGSSDNRVKIWNAETGQLLQTLIGHTRWVNEVIFSADNLKIVSGSDDNSIKIWNAETGQLLRTLNGHTNSINSVAISNNFSTDLDKKLTEYIHESIQ